MENDPKYDFETAMTVGQSAIVGMDNQYHFEDYYRELPRPEGEGWELKQVLPIHNNNRFLQYFWQRKIPLEDIDNATDGQIKSTDINLNG